MEIKMPYVKTSDICDITVAREAARQTLALPNKQAWAEICRLLAQQNAYAHRQAAWVYRKQLQRARRQLTGGHDICDITP
jgi:hypothetical protein